MRYKIKNSSSTGKKLLAIHNELGQAKDASFKLAKELGATDVYTYGRDVFGGVDALGFADTPDLKVWKHMGKKHQNTFYPRSGIDDSIIAKIKALPTVEVSRINKIVGFKPAIVESTDPGVLMVHVKCVSLQFVKGYTLIGVDLRIKFKPNADMVEILESEYIKLTKPKKEAKWKSVPAG